MKRVFTLETIRVLMKVASQREEETISPSGQRLDIAWNWLCNARKKSPPNADIWDLRFHWSTRRPALLSQLHAGTYRLSPMLVVGKQSQVMWLAEDALVLKWVALGIEGFLPLHEKCEHVKGHGGGSVSIARVQQAILQQGYTWVCRTDICGYYGSINKAILLSQLKRYVQDPVYMDLLTQYVRYSIEDAGEFYTPAAGIARGCALSPLMGAMHLWQIDHHFSQQKNMYYARYMDDVIILTRSRWSLRKRVRALNVRFEQLGFQQHPDKTFIGRVNKGFDWMGALLGSAGVTSVAPRALANHLQKIRRLYERMPRSLPVAEKLRRVSCYRRRWTRWAKAACLLWGAAPTLAPAVEFLPVGDVVPMLIYESAPTAAPTTATTRTLLTETVYIGAQGTNVNDFGVYGIRGSFSVEITCNDGSKAGPFVFDLYTANFQSGQYCETHLRFDVRTRQPAAGFLGGVTKMTLEAGDPAKLASMTVTLQPGATSTFRWQTSNPESYKLKPQRAAPYSITFGDGGRFIETDLRTIALTTNSCAITVVGSNIVFDRLGYVTQARSGEPIASAETGLAVNCDGASVGYQYSVTGIGDSRPLPGTKSHLRTSMPGLTIRGGQDMSSCSDAGLDMYSGHRVAGLHAVTAQQTGEQTFYWGLCGVPNHGRAGLVKSEATLEVTWD